MAAAAILLTLACHRVANVTPSTAAKSLPELASAARQPGRVLVVNHWATWCGPCVDELPYLAEVAAKYGDRVQFLGISWDRFTDDGALEEVLANVDQVRTKTGTTYPTVVAPNDAKGVVQTLGLDEEFIPQTYVFGADGARVWSKMGEFVEDADKAAFIAAIDGALAKAKK